MKLFPDDLRMRLYSIRGFRPRARPNAIDSLHVSSSLRPLQEGENIPSHGDLSGTQDLVDQLEITGSTANIPDHLKFPLWLLGQGVENGSSSFHGIG